MSVQQSRGPLCAQDAGKKQVAAVMGIQTTRASTVARPFMRLLPQKLTVQVPGSDAEAEVLTLFSPCADNLWKKMPPLMNSRSFFSEIPALGPIKPVGTGPEGKLCRGHTRAHAACCFVSCRGEALSPFAAA